jgi:hypothetical protein
VSRAATDQLYQLLPAIYRLRDAEQGEPLKALIAALAAQAELVEADIARLYESWFIETCDEWLVPYIGDLLGVRGLLAPERAGWSQRALVANTLRYRRRKGTVPLLEQLARDVAGWPARAVELFNSVAVTPYLDHPRPGLGIAANLCALRGTALIGSAFDPLAYTPDVRLMSGTRRPAELDAERPVPWSARRLVGVGQPRPNLPNIGLFIWRLKPYRVERATAFPHGGGRFSFSPLGQDMPLCNSPAPRDFSAVAQEHELPVALRTEALAAELAERRQARAEKRALAPRFLGVQPAFAIYAPGADAAIAPEQILICSLRHTGSEEWIDPRREAGCRVAVDPESGRILFPGGLPEHGVRVSYSYAFSADIGGGPYDRRRPSMELPDTVGRPDLFGTPITIGDPGDPRASDQAGRDPLGAALRRWADAGRPPAVIQIAANHTLALGDRGLAVELGGASLTIQAANHRRPILVGDLVVSSSKPGAALTLSGLLIAGSVRVSDGLERLTLVDCTLVPGVALRSGGSPRHPQTPSVIVAGPADTLLLTVDHSVVGPLRLPATCRGLAVRDSIVDAPEPPRLRPMTSFAGAAIIRPGALSGQLPALAADQRGERPGPAARIERSTIFGRVRLVRLELAEDVLFTGLLLVERADRGLLRNCHVPTGSTRLHREHAGELPEEQGPPAFSARRYGEPGYAQLSLECPAAIRAGGTSGGEIGAFHSLRQPQREAALLAQLEEYLRFGVEAGLIYVN